VNRNDKAFFGAMAVYVITVCACLFLDKSEPAVSIVQACWLFYMIGFLVGRDYAAKGPTRQKFTTGDGTYTVAKNATHLKVRMVGGGGDGSGPIAIDGKPIEERYE
jgi:hypothetical protein